MSVQADSRATFGFVGKPENLAGTARQADTGCCLASAVAAKREKLVLLMFVETADCKVQTLLGNDRTARTKRVVHLLRPA